MAIVYHMQDEPRAIGPYPGMQQAALESPADLVVFGALAGCGKTHGQFLIILQRVMMDAPGTGVLIRRLLTDITDAGGLLDRLDDFFATVPARYRPFRIKHGNNPSMRWKVRGGEFRLSLRGFKDVAMRQKFQGTPYDLILFDEADHFLLSQIEYLFSRLRRIRAADGVVPRVYLTCNPMPSGWLYDLVKPWLEHIPGKPSSWGKIDGRSGEIRVMARQDNGDSRGLGAYYISEVAADQRRRQESFRQDVMAAYAEVRERFPGRTPMSIAVIGGTREDNLAQDWGRYDRGLSMLEEADRLALRDGIWGVTPADPRRIYRFSSRALFGLEDDLFVEALKDPDLRVFRGHDYGRAEHGLAFVTAVCSKSVAINLGVGRRPIVWVVEGVVLTGASAEDAVLRRMQSNDDLSELLGIELSELSQVDYGDPSGETRDPRGAEARPAGAGWAASYRAMGVPLSDLAHHGSGRWWNQPEGIAENLAMVNAWLSTGRLRIADAPGTATLREAMSMWRWDVSQEVGALIDANVAHPRPMKDVHSHPCDGLRYGCAGIARWLSQESEGAERREDREESRRHRESSARLSAALMGGYSIPGR